MKSLRLLVCLSGALLLVIEGAQATSHPAQAYEPEMDYWFIETFTLDEADLPEGVTIAVSDPAESPRSHLVVRNQTDTPLYVMSLNYKDVLVMATPDPGWKDWVDLAHEAAAYLALPERPAALSMEALVDLDKSLVDQNVLTFELPPEGLAIPSAQRSELLIVYQGQVIEVPFTITYSLNTAFNNGSEAYRSWMENVQVAENANSSATLAAEYVKAREARNDVIIVGLAGLALLLVIWAAWRRLISHH